MLLIADNVGGASLVKPSASLNTAPGRRVHYSIGWELSARERTALDRVPASAWGAVLDRDGAPRDLDEAGVVELTALLRHGPGGDQLAHWPADLRVIAAG